MNQEEFRASHKNLKFRAYHAHELNVLPSATDPTQDIPVKRIQIGMNGDPLNVRKHSGLVISGLSADKMTAIDRRNNDKFDVVSELQASERKLREYKPISKIVKNEN